MKEVISEKRIYVCNLFLIPCLSGLLPAHVSCRHPFLWSYLISYFPIRLAIPRGRRLNCCEKRFRFEILEQGHIAKKRSERISLSLLSLAGCKSRFYCRLYPSFLTEVGSLFSGTFCRNLEHESTIYSPLPFLPSFFSLFLGRGTRDDPNICSIRSRIRRKSRSFVPSPTFYRVGDEEEIV